jgi:DNA (cytosine-5)-methyltransferase 1
MALGFENAGFRHLLLNDNDKHAVATLRRNRPGWTVAGADIRDMDFRGFLGVADVVQGGFPCQAFSYGGKKRGFSDTRGVLFFEFLRAVREVMPRAVVGENVKGLATHDGGRTMAVMLRALEGIGYRMAFKVLRAQHFDVPQNRERLVVIGLRNDVVAPLVFPEESGQTFTVREAIGDGPISDGRQYSERKRQVMALVPEGGNWRSLPADVQDDYLGVSLRSGGSCSGVARRLAWDKPSPTLLCSPDQKLTELCHPSETRPLNVREYARIQTFPDDWEFEGSLTARYRQIGNAVPVNLAYQVGIAVAAMLRA